MQSIDLTAFVREWVQGTPNFGIMLSDGGIDGINFGSSESADSPQLEVVYLERPRAVASQWLSGKTAAAEFLATLPAPQTYSWNILAIDVLGRQSWAAANFQLVVDSSFPNPPLLVSPPEFTIVVLPDTQFYSAEFPVVYTAQTEWIANSIASRNILFVTHLGDVVLNAW